MKRIGPKDADLWMLIWEEVYSLIGLTAPGRLGRDLYSMCCIAHNVCFEVKRDT